MTRLQDRICNEAAKIHSSPADQRTFIHSEISFGAETVNLPAETKRALIEECFEQMEITGENEVYEKAAIPVPASNNPTPKRRR